MHHYLGCEIVLIRNKKNNTLSKFQSYFVTNSEAILIGHNNYQKSQKSISTTKQSSMTFKFDSTQFLQVSSLKNLVSNTATKTSNKAQKKRGKKKNLSGNPENTSTENLFNSNTPHISNKALQSKKNPKTDRSISVETQSTSLRNSLEKKEYHNIGLTKNQQENEDNVNSRHELAIQGANIRLQHDQKKRICGVDRLAHLDQNSKIVQNPLTKGTRQLLSIRMITSYQQLKRADIIPYFGQKYIIRYQAAFPQIKELNLWRSKEIQKQLQMIRGISLNVDTYIEAQDRKRKQKYRKTQQYERIQQIMNKLRKVMNEGIDYILLQQVNSKLFRASLLKLLKGFNLLGKDKYSYPSNLEQQDELITTMIITKHDVKFGQYKFQIKNPQNQKILSLSEQSFCEFQISIDGKTESVCIFNCHLKSDRGQKLRENRIIRKQQLDILHKFGKNYDRFICVGDTNIGTSKSYKCQDIFLKERFEDAHYYQHSEERGTFLYYDENGQLFDERLDRVLIDKRNASTTFVKIDYVDVKLDYFTRFGFNRNQLINKLENCWQYKTITDHTMLDFKIFFCK